MKNSNKILAVLLAIVMTIALACTVLAADPITVTINGDGSKYVAYKLMDAPAAITCGNTEADHVHSDACYTYAYSLNSAYASYVKAALSLDSTATDEEVLAEIKALDADGVRSFADTVYNAIKALDPDIASDNKTFAVEEGYYLIAEKTTNASDDSDTATVVLLDTVGQKNIEIDEKEDTPTIEKFIIEDGRKKAIDAALNDVITFELEAKISNYYDSYSAYYIDFADTLGDGFTFDPESTVTVKIDGTAIGFDNVTPVYSGNSLSWAIADLKDVLDADNKPIAKAGSVITLTYTAKLNENAVIGDAGNPNKVFLKYSNDPYDEDSLGTSVEKTVYVYTYQVTVNKVDNKDAALVGAGFTLYKWDGEAYVEYAELNSTEDAPISTFEFKRLDAGKYKLEESQIPHGYHGASDIEFTLAGKYNDANDAIVAIIVNGVESENTDFTHTVKFINSNEAELPSTGGIGTTILYIVGGLLVAGAVVVLVTRKRMNSAD